MMNMQSTLLLAGSILLLTGSVHSVLGEILIFRHLRPDGIVPSRGASPLRERHIRILWATWHLATVLGWAFAGILFKLASKSADDPLDAFVLASVVIAYAVGGLLVLIATKGRHPGWIALLAVAALALTALGG